MRVFVSYSRKDNDDDALREIERQVRDLLPGSTPYLDDLHHDPDHDRHEGVERAFCESDAFVAVVSPRYRRTHWTRKEFRWAVASPMPIYLLISEQHFTASAA
ncbi:TIR domain-containing protein [Lentzea sp. NPDC004782]|jgi:hypothetical protein|uniref:TIR domain-containing protein n=1 Tax=Lentzea sp. NPDC004782 TaxID=3154458 RepID=UPI0033BE4A46